MSVLLFVLACCFGPALGMEQGGDISQFKQETFFEMLGNWSFGDYAEPFPCFQGLDSFVSLPNEANESTGIGSIQRKSHGLFPKWHKIHFEIKKDMIVATGKDLNVGAITGHFKFEDIERIDPEARGGSRFSTPASVDIHGKKYDIFKISSKPGTAGREHEEYEFAVPQPPPEGTADCETYNVADAVADFDGSAYYSGRNFAASDFTGCHANFKLVLAVLDCAMTSEPAKEWIRDNTPKLVSWSVQADVKEFLFRTGMCDPYEYKANTHGKPCTNAMIEWARKAWKASRQQVEQQSSGFRLAERETNLQPRLRAGVLEPNF